jgi:hypothetical protein
MIEQTRHRDPKSWSPNQELASKPKQATQAATAIYGIPWDSMGVNAFTWNFKGLRPADTVENRTILIMIRIVQY